MTTRLEHEVNTTGQLQPDQRAALTRAAARRLSAQLNAAKARKRMSRLTLISNSIDDVGA